MAITEVVSQQNAVSLAATGTTITLTYPVAPTSGDLLVVSLGFSAAPGTITPPAGWTIAANDSTTTPSVVIYYHQAGPSEPTTYAWNWTTKVKAAAVGSEYSGIASATLDKSTWTATSSTAGSTGATGTLTNANELVISAFSNVNTWTWSAYNNGQTQSGQIASTGGNTTS